MSQRVGERLEKELPKLVSKSNVTIETTLLMGMIVAK
jgi:hypothetical protein